MVQIFRKYQETLSFTNGTARLRSVSKSQSFVFDLWFTWTNHFIFDSDSFRFTILFDFYYNIYILICDSIWFYSFWFGLILIRRESRFTRESWFICESKIKGKWIMIHSFANHELIRFRYKSESKWIANQAGPSPDEWYTYVGFLKFPVEKNKKSIWCGVKLSSSGMSLRLKRLIYCDKTTNPVLIRSKGVVHNNLLIRVWTIFLCRSIESKSFFNKWFNIIWLLLVIIYYYQIKEQLSLFNRPWTWAFNFMFRI